MAENGIRELRCRRERLVLVPEVGAEELVDRCKHLRPRAVVERQRQELLRLLAPRPEDADVRMSKAVDRLELVPDEEHLGIRRAEEVDEVALKPVRVLELVDHDRAEAQALPLPNLRVVAKEVARLQLEILEVERRLAHLRGRVRGREALEQLLQKCPVTRGRSVEGGLLDALARFLVRRRTLAT